MFEFGIFNISTNDENIIFGYDFSDACKRANLNAEDWGVTYYEYID